MREHLQPWYDKWLAAHQDTNLIYARQREGGEPSLHQVHFVRDTLSSLLWADVPYEKRARVPPPRDDCRETVFVISEHHSKSVRLPVYSLERADLGLQFVLRDNYYDRCLSVVAETPITTDLRGFELDYGRDEDRKRFPNGYTPGRSWGYCFFQGFPEELQFGPFSENQRKFSLCIGHDYGVYTFLWLILRDRRRSA